MRSILTAVELSLAVSLGFALGCSNRLSEPLGHPRDTPPRRGGHLTLASYVGLRSLDPAVAFDEGSDPIERMLFARLIRVSKTGQFEGELAESFEASEDGLVLTFRLRPGARFHDGAEVKAADIKRSLERSLDAKTPCPIPSFYDRLVGYDEFHEGKVGSLAGIQVVSEYEVRFLLREPDAVFLAVLTLPPAAPVCASAGRSYEASFSKHACGAGPYKIRQWDEQDRLVLERQDGYVDRSLPYLDSITWLFAVPLTSQRFRFERGEIDHLRDLSVADAFSFLADPKWQGLGAWTASRMTKGLFLNVEMSPFDRLEVRRAVAAAIDREAIGKLRGGMAIPADRMVPAGVLGYDASFPGQRYDLAAALEDMKRGGFPFDPATGTGGYPETIDYLVPTDSFDLQFAEVVQQQLARIGLRIRLKTLSWTAYLALIGRRKTVRLGAAGWTADYDDPSNFFEPLFATKAIQDDNSQNYAFFSNAELDELLERGRKVTDKFQRKTIYRRAEEIIRDQAPWAPAYGFRRYEVWQGYVRGYQPNPFAQQDLGFLWLDLEQRRAQNSARCAPPLSITALASLLSRRGSR